MDFKKQIYEDNYVYGTPGITVYPEYLGGLQKLYKFIKENYEIPIKANKSKGKIIVSFAVNKIGILEDLKVKKDIGFETGNKLLETLAKTSKWYPAEYNGKKQVVYFDLEVNVKNDTVKKMLGKKIIAKIDNIELIRNTEFEH